MEPLEGRPLSFFKIPFQHQNSQSYLPSISQLLVNRSFPSVGQTTVSNFTANQVTLPPIYVREEFLSPQVQEQRIEEEKTEKVEIRKHPFRPWESSRVVNAGSSPIIIEDEPKNPVKREKKRYRKTETPVVEVLNFPPKKRKKEERLPGEGDPIDFVFSTTPPQFSFVECKPSMVESDKQSKKKEDSEERAVDESELVGSKIIDWFDYDGKKGKFRRIYVNRSAQ
jgi:hypothetical protein